MINRIQSVYLSGVSQGNGQMSDLILKQTQKRHTHALTHPYTVYLETNLKIILANRQRNHQTSKHWRERGGNKLTKINENLCLTTNCFYKKIIRKWKIFFWWGGQGLEQLPMILWDKKSNSNGHTSIAAPHEW